MCEAVRSEGYLLTEPSNRTGNASFRWKVGIVAIVISAIV